MKWIIKIAVMGSISMCMWYFAAASPAGRGIVPMPPLPVQVKTFLNKAMGDEAVKGPSLIDQAKAAVAAANKNVQGTQDELEAVRKG